jgi:hypothetical protein
MWLNRYFVLMRMIATLVVLSPLEFSQAKEPPSKDALKGTPEQSGAVAVTYEFRDPREILIKGPITVDVMELVAPQRLNELALRLKEATSKNPEWWLEHVKKAKPGEPIAYDPKLGLTKVEFDEFLALSKQMGMRKKSEAKLNITSKEEDVFVLDGGEALPELTGIEIDLKNDLVRTPFGVAKERTIINAPEKAALGAWSGVQWKFERANPDGISGTFAKLAIGKLKRTGRGVIYYDVLAAAKVGQVRIKYILNFDLPMPK